MKAILRPFSILACLRRWSDQSKRAESPLKRPDLVALEALRLHPGLFKCFLITCFHTKILLYGKKYVMTFCYPLSKGLDLMVEIISMIPITLIFFFFQVYNHMSLLLKSLLSVTRSTPAYRLSRRQVLNKSSELMHLHLSTYPRQLGIYVMRFIWTG